MPRPACARMNERRRLMRRAWAVLAWLWLALPAAVLAEPRHVTTAQFLLQDEAAAAAPDLVPARGPPGDWQSVALPHAGLQRRVVPDPQAGDAALAWYRLDLDAGGVDDPVLYLPRWQTVGRLAVYGDGKLLYRSGGSAQWSSFNRPVWLLAAGGTPPATLLLLRISSLDGAGAGLSTVWVGAAGELRWRYELRRWLQQDLPYLASAVFLALGLFALGVWAVRRKESIYGLFFAASVVFYLRCLHYHAGPFQLLLDDEWFSWLTITSVGWLAIASYFFAFRLHGRAYPRSERAMLAGMGALTAAMLPVWQIHPHLVLLAPLAYLGITVVALFACLLAVWGAWRARSRDGLVLACWNLAAIPVAVHDMLLQNYRLSMEHVYLLPYTGIGMFVIFLYVAYRRYVNALAQAAGAQATLQRRLAERERELSAATAACARSSAPVSWPASANASCRTCTTAWVHRWCRRCAWCSTATARKARWRRCCRNAWTICGLPSIRSSPRRPTWPCCWPRCAFGSDRACRPPGWRSTGGSARCRRCPG